MVIKKIHKETFVFLSYFREYEADYLELEKVIDEISCDDEYHQDIIIDWRDNGTISADEIDMLSQATLKLHRRKQKLKIIANKSIKEKLDAFNISEMGDLTVY